jgi:HprK-related kinase A
LSSVKAAELSLIDLNRYLRSPGLTLRSGSFLIRIKSDLPDLPAVLHRLYAPYPLEPDAPFADIHIHLKRWAGFRAWWHGEARIWLEDDGPFSTFPRDTALPLLEWGINWCVATRAYHYLLLHAGAVEKGGQALLLPAWPGAGKSTLCAALSQHGWRLLSDEFAITRPADLAIVPFPRLISLKNQSIAVIRDFAPEAVLGPEYPKTRKGTVAHLRPPDESIERAGETARAAWIVFPEYRAGAGLHWQPMTKTQAFILLSRNSFNYEKIGLRGFQTVVGLVDSCACYSLRYSNLEQVIAHLDALAA